MTTVRYILALSSTFMSEPPQVFEQVLATKRLLLRPLSSGDAGFVLELLNQPSFIQFIGDRNVRTLNQAREYIANGPMLSYQHFGFGLLHVQLRTTNASIGICGLVQRNYLPDADIGFALLPAYWSQGFALEAATTIVDYSFKTLAMQRLLAVVQPDNAASTKLLHKLGFGNARFIKTVANQPELLLLERIRQVAPLQ